jgi:DNA-directed RNA polymerase subunit RPC12/RpoP
MEGLLLIAIIGFFIWWFREKSKKSNSEYDYNPVYRQKNQIINPTPDPSPSNQAKCPRCGSTNLQALNQQAKVKRGLAYQVVMAFLFLISFGILWLLLGNIRKKVIQTYVVCLNCGYKRLI